MTLNLEMLKDMLEEEDERVNKKIGAIDRNLTRASRIAKELLHFSRDKETALEATDIQGNIMILLFRDTRINYRERKVQDPDRSHSLQAIPGMISHMLLVGNTRRHVLSIRTDSLLQLPKMVQS